MQKNAKSNLNNKLPYFVVIGLFLVIISVRIPILMAIGDFLIISTPLHSADVIHVISGLDHRTVYGINLIKEGYGKQIFFTGSWCEEIQDVHAARGKQLALNQGVSEAQIATDSTEVISTYEEATRFRVFIEQSPFPVESVIVVSDPFHMRRAKWTYERVLGGDIEIQMAPVPFEMTEISRRWWEDRESMKMVMEEYTKSIYYLLRYGLGWKILSDWLATFDYE